MTIAELFAQRSKKDIPFPDIWEHMETLRDYASRCSHITEFGTRTGNSTTALLYGLSGNGGKLFSYDLNPTEYSPPEIPGVQWTFRRQDTGAYDFIIEPTEILFIDSCHNYDHVKKELRHHERATRWIIMHDTSPNWGYGTGPLYAMAEFVSTHHWKVDKHFDNCNGLTILTRR